MRITIIGGAGRMGTWFANYFVEKGHTVRIFDVRRRKAEEVAKKLGVESVNDVSRAVENSDHILVSVPIEATPTVLRELAPLLRKDVILAEIASLKKRTEPVLRQIGRRGILALSIHPLFGPGANDIVRKKIALIPISDEQREIAAAKQLFPEANLLTIGVDEHDRIMAAVLSLTHFVSLIFASALAHENISALRKFGGPSFLTQLTLAQSMLSEDPSNYFSIQSLNKSTIPYLRKFLSGFQTLSALLQNQDRSGFIQFFLKCRKWLYTDPKAFDAYQKMYTILDLFEN